MTPADEAARADDPGAAALAERVRASFERQGAMATLGITLGEVGAGHVSLWMSHAPGLTQQHGYVHAGVVSTALDSACGYAAFTLMPPEAAVLTIEFKVNLLAPAAGPRFRFDGRVVKAGRTISVAEGQAWQLAAPQEPPVPPKLIATLTATVMTVQGRALRD